MSHDEVWAYRPDQPLLGAVNGPLSGLTFSVKDLFGVSGWPLRASSEAVVPDPGPSPLVQHLLALGATALGKTQLHEIALGITGMNGFGGTEHPFLKGHVPGGSSSGAAVSVARGAVDFALGTDTGGSIRVPAAWCGVVGFKPSKGHPAWPTEGVLPLSWTCDHAGPLARDLATIVQVHQALSGEELPAVDVSGLRIGLWLPEGWTDPVVREATLAVAEQLQRRGAEFTPVHFPNVLDAYSTIVLHEAAQVHAQALAQQPDPPFMPFTLEALRRGARLSAVEVQTAFERRAEYRALLDGLLTAFDVLLAPAVPTAPPRRGEGIVSLSSGPEELRTAVLRLTAPFSLLGVPVLALPTATPYVGVQLIGGPGADARLLSLGLPLQTNA